LKRFLSILLAAALLSFALPFCAQSQSAPGGERGLFVCTGADADFPSAANLSSKALRGELEAICAYAKDAGNGAVYFEIRPHGAALYRSGVFPLSETLVKTQRMFTAFDPLRELLKIAAKQGLAVYAVLDPYDLGASRSALPDAHPAKQDGSLSIEQDGRLLLDPRKEQTLSLNERDLREISARYPSLAGVMLEGLRAAESEDAAALTETLQQALGRIPLGALYGQEDGSLAEALSLPFAAVQIDAFTGFDEENFAAVLAEWRARLGGALRVFIDASDPALPAEEAAARVFAAQQNGIGSIVGDYRCLHGDGTFAGSLIASIANPTDTEPYTIGYDPPQTLTITRPQKALTTSYSSYFIMGTSDPDRPLTLDGSEIDRRTGNGVFGVLVDLAYGTNTFRFAQGRDMQTVTITRPTSSEGEAATTTRITSMTPKDSEIVASGQTLELSCIAPANTTVTATFGGRTVSLEQVAAASTGVPARFRGEIPVGTAAAGQVLDAGPVTYQIVNYGTEFTSNGSVYLAGEGAVPTVTVNTTSASVFYDEEVKAGDFKAIYKTGVTDRVVGSMDDYYELVSGYIKKSDVDVNPMDAPQSVAVTAIETQHDEHAERFLLRGAQGLPYTFVDNEDGTIDLTLYGVSLPEQRRIESELFSSIDWAEQDGNITAHFTPSGSRGVWALDVFPSPEGTVIYARRTPKLSGTVGRPLEGVSVVLDPGHGGNDPGAISTTGGTENELNFANATRLKARLEQLGASVTLTRSAPDETASLYERVGVGQSILPDFFISLHHNSIVEYADGYKHSGVEAYYYENFGKAVAGEAVAHIAQANYDRAYRFYEWGYYIVTKNRFAPSILCEIGFVPNPVESRYISDETEIYKTANAFCAAILSVIAAANGT